MTSGPAAVDAAESEGRSRALPWEICLSAVETIDERRFRTSLINRPGRRRCTPSARSESPCNVDQRKELGRSQGRPTDRQKSADAILSQRAGWRRAEHEEMNRRGAFDA